MGKLEDYIRSLNPKPEHRTILVYGASYNCFRNNLFIGVGVWSEDENIGDCFKGKTDANDILILIPDAWELIINKDGK